MKAFIIGLLALSHIVTFAAAYFLAIHIERKENEDERSGLG